MKTSFSRLLPLRPSAIFNLPSSWIAASAALCLAAFAADPLTESLQKGLLEEEVNRDLNAAVKAYERAVQQADAQRQAAATAVFRLAESYRKLDRTNEAVAQYRRVLEQFGDQSLLAAMSRTNLLMLGAAVATGGAPAGTMKDSSEARMLGDQLAGIERFENDPEKQAQAVLAFFPDEDLRRMLSHLAVLNAQAAALQQQPDGTTNYYYRATGAQIERLVKWHENTLVTFAKSQEEVRKQLEMIAPRVQFILGTQQARLAVIQGSVGAAVVSSDAVPAPDPAEVASYREEIRLVEKELEATRKQIESGRAVQAEVFRLQHELLRLQRRLPENAGRDRQVTMIQEELKLTETNLAEVRRKIEVGAAAPLDEVPARRELLALQRELAAAQRLASKTPMAIAPGGPAPAGE